ncbi:hypothetical protein BD311DRAFT_794033 [Dichomitus squalens]|uniref:RNA polymerase II elongation factor ELL N-terminal domain-containing protein n=1 Tax=Dichomitus squalens TaxID=114155 RepID=A0A4V2K1Q4_9APHY|nr:hypothetical protein BD311DRAFT_794033 [Dichomitus squalens]
MPLPANSTVLLQGSSQPGDPLGYKPKQAMLIRMTQETFEALQDPETHSSLEFNFGNAPGLYIGGTFFPVQPSRENAHNHELYLRTPSAQKPRAPLKLFGSVIGKFRVERQLDEKVEESVRDRTLEAAKQRTERHTKYLDTPPDLSYSNSKTGTKKKTGAASRVSVQAKSYPVSKPSPLPSRDVHTAASSSSLSAADQQTRERIIHFLALEPRTMSKTLDACCGKDRTEEQERKYEALIRQVAEPMPVKKGDTGGPPLWHLQRESWREVRPYTFPKLSEEERLGLSRQARLVFKALQIPESDPIWNNVRHRIASGAASGSAGPSAPAPEKNGVVMTKNSTKKAKGEGTRKRPLDIAIPSKDESGSAKAKSRDVDEGSAAGTPMSASRPTMGRRLPGSGFKVKPSPTPPTERRTHSPLPPPPKKAGPVDARESKRSAPEPSGSAKPLPPIAPPQTQESRSASVSAAAAKIRKKEAQSSAGTSRTAESRREERERERERVRERDHAAEEKLRVKEKERASPLPILPASAPLPSFKRKKPPQDGNDSEYSEREPSLSASSSKKRKLDAEPPSSTEKARSRDLSLPKKPVVREPSPLAPPRQKIKTEPSPLSSSFSPPRPSLPPKPVGAEKHQTSSSSSSVKSAKATEAVAPSRPSGKSKRRSPIYTSSSQDESETSVPVSRPRTAVPTAHRDSPSAEPPAKRRRLSKVHVPRFKPRPLPSDLASLRKYYRSCYSTYLDLYGEQTKRRNRIQRMLKRLEGEQGEESAPSDEDMEDLVPEVLKAFMDNIDAVVQEMKKVSNEIERLGGKVENGTPVME